MVPFAEPDHTGIETGFRAAIEAMAAGVVVHDATGAIVSANPAAERILRLTLAEMQGRHPISPSWHLIRADGSPLPPEEIPSERTLRTGESCHNQIVGVATDDDKPTWLSINTVPLRGPTGVHTGVVATFADITAQIEMTRTLEHSRTFLERITGAVPGVLYQYLIQPDGSEAFPYASAQLESVFGVAAKAALTNPQEVWSKIHPDDLPSVVAGIVEAVTAIHSGSTEPGAGLYEREFRIEREPGQWRWVEARSRGALVPEGILFNGFIQDVTERHQMADQVRTAQRQELLGLLAAGIAHNFNNMLAAILPNLEHARHVVSDDIKPEIEDAHRAAISAAELVRQLMQLVRRERPEASEPVDLMGLTTEALQICRRTFERRFLIEEVPADASVVVRARRSDLEQVILNLCINARDAMVDTAEPRLRVQVTADPSAKQAIITIADNGIGMANEVKKRLGEPFFSTKAPGQRTGLGLATAYGIIRDLGGLLDCESSLGHGTTFRLRLPMVEDAVPMAAPNPDLVAIREFMGRTALVIDDEPMVRAAAERILTRFGLTTLVASDGADGLALLARHPEVAVAIVDLSMPGLSGTEVLARIKRERPGLPVVICSGYIENRQLLAAADALLNKPFAMSDLRNALLDVLQPRGLQ